MARAARIDELTDLAEDPDADLLARYADGDPHAARALSDSLGPRLFSVAQRMLNDRAEAEDVTQEAMLRVWRIAPEWEKGRARLSSWAYQVVLNLCRDRLRRSRAVPLDGVAEPTDPAPGPEASLQQAARAAALQDALMALPERQRQAVILRHIEGLANPQIAEILDTGIEAVESLTARGKRALAQHLAGRREELGMIHEH